MPESLAQSIVVACAAYVLIGASLLPWWFLRGLARLDTAAGRASSTVKLLWSPGLLALWPWLLRRGLRGDGHPPAEHNAHRRAAQPGRRP